MPTPAPTSPEDPRQIRVFVSSTFRDMQAERDHLVKFVFPELRRLCERRQVTWSEIDLRWGITDEEVAEGKVLPICLAEINRCRPYFICLLGERYGWINRKISDEIIAREPWLKEHAQGGKSITELEILHGVLNNADAPHQAFFYFRDPAYVSRLPPGARRQDFVSEDAASAEKLQSLKRRIRQSGQPVRESYADPRALGELVKADLAAVIDARFPEGSQPDPLDLEAAEHQAYARSRERVYVGRPDYFARLDACVDGGAPAPLVILGASGAGKSALLANWAARYQAAHADLLLQHYVGASPHGADWTVLVRRLMGELARHLRIEREIPQDPDALRGAFAEWLELAARKGPLILVLDALDKLDERDGGADLSWLPPALPGGVCLIASALPGRALDEAGRRGWRTMTIEPLAASERREIITQTLRQHGRSLSHDRVERIAETPACANPLFLRVLLDELRVFGVNERLAERIDLYLAAHDPAQLYERVLQRWEQDYGEALVSGTLRLIWAARRGLSEPELLDLLGRGGEPLARAYWTPFHLAAEPSFTQAAGLLMLSHFYLREAVHRRYLSTPDARVGTHRLLADYFGRRTDPAGDLTWSGAAYSRGLTELPHHLAQAGDWDRLVAMLAGWAYFDAAMRNNVGLAVSREYGKCAPAALAAAGDSALPACAALALSERYVASIRLQPGTGGTAGGLGMAEIRDALVDLAGRTSDHAAAVVALASAAMALSAIPGDAGARLWRLAFDRHATIFDAQERVLPLAVLAISAGALQQPQAGDLAEKTIGSLDRIGHTHTRWREAARAGALLIASGPALAGAGERAVAVVTRPVEASEIARNFSVQRMRYGASGAAAFVQDAQRTLLVEARRRRDTLEGKLAPFPDRSRWPALAVEIAREVTAEPLFPLVVDLVAAVGRSLGSAGDTLSRLAAAALPDDTPGLDGVSRRNRSAERKDTAADVLGQPGRTRLDEWTGTMVTDPTNQLIECIAKVAAVAAVDRSAAQSLVGRIARFDNLDDAIIARPRTLDDFHASARMLFVDLGDYQPEAEYLDGETAWFLRGMVAFAQAITRGDLVLALDVGRRFQFSRSEILAVLTRAIARRPPAERIQLCRQAIGLIPRSAPWESEGLVAMLCGADQAFAAAFMGHVGDLDAFRNASSEQ